MKHLLIITLFFITISSYAQEESRLGGRIKYATSLNLFPSFESGENNTVDLVRVGIERDYRYWDNTSFRIALEVGQGKVSLPDATITGYSKENLTLGTLYLGGNTEFFDGLFYTSVGAIIEYDFITPESSRYIRQNGIGLYFDFGVQFHLNDDYMITLQPGFSSRNLFKFDNGGNSSHSDLDSDGGVDGTISIGVARLFY